jgi:protease-4
LKSFFKSFFASLLAIIVFFGLIFLLFVGIAGALMSDEKPTVETKSVLVIDLSKSFTERENEDIVAQLTGKEDNIAPTLSTVLKLIEAAKTDSLIKGIYIIAKENANGYASSNELRQSLLDFKLSGKFILSFGDYISQKAYYVANVSDKIYCNPKGLVEWQGMSVEYTYFKNLIDKLEIKPQIFYAGKFKSATEPFREAQMTEPNRIQTTMWLNDLYSEIINTTAVTRKLNADSLRSFANRYAIVDPAIAVEKGLIDGLKYDDQLKDILRTKLNIDKTDKINFIGLSRYNKSNPIKASFEKDKIAVIMAEGEIVYGKGEMDQVGSEEYMSLLRKIRDDKSIKAVVLRVNSPGGSSLASEMIWRELELIKKSGKPIIVSMGNVAASGGYYIACNANEIYADENTITGSIGVFSIIPDFSSFMKNKLGITDRKSVL